MARPSQKDAPKKAGFHVEVSHERVALPNGREIVLDIVHHPGAAAVVPFVAKDEVVLIRQFRHAAGGTILEVPAGKLDAGEPPERCAARELAEEAGYRAGRIVALASIWTTPGFTDEKIHLFAAFDLTRTKSRPEDDEVIEVIQVPLDEALAMIWRGELCDAKSALALIHAARHVGRLE
jgi:ADP-ribose pyrophosphatase